MGAAPSLGIRIKRARERRHLTQRQFAVLADVDIKTVDNWENDRTRPRNRLGAIEQILGVDLSEQPEPGPLDDLYRTALQNPDLEWAAWEVGVLEDAAIPVETRRRLIENSRAARARSEERREAHAEGRSPGNQAAG